MLGTVAAYCYEKDVSLGEFVSALVGNNINPKTEEITVKPEPKPEEPTAVSTQNISPPSPEAKERITQNPPKRKTTKSIAGTTTRNSDGSKTTVVAESGVSQAELSRVAASSANPSTPFEVVVNDKTGRNNSLIQPLKDYLNSNLKWGSELRALKEIDIEDAGETGWSGQYAGSYTESSDGIITSAYGFIILNTHYETNADIALDYFKLVLAHEYGHHYSLYHKWVDGNLPAGTRFPDSYYSVRPLSKDNTSTDCSAGWSSCEPEIVAEDYSYLYSGYGYHALAGAYGYPSAGTKGWFDNITVNIKGTSSAITTASTPNFPPTITITSPTDGDTISAQFNFTVTVSDDRGIAKVTFYRDSTVLAEQTSAPFSVSIDLTSLNSGTYTFKAKAYDSDGATAERSFSVQFTKTESSLDDSEPEESSVSTTTSNSASGDVLVDTIQPSVIFTKPASSPFTWADGNLAIEISGTDNVAVTKIELYINEILVATENASTMARIWQGHNVAVGSYTLKTKAYDAAGNIGENSIVVIKS